MIRSCLETQDFAYETYERHEKNKTKSKDFCFISSNSPKLPVIKILRFDAHETYEMNEKQKNSFIFCLIFSHY